MRKSEIFESFVKIAQERGLLSEAEHAEHTEKDFPETNPRHDSLSIEQIGKLYGVKPDAPKDMEYKRNIIEDAHPDPVVTAPSYDKLNGLVENENEGQNIRLRIVMKDPDGHLVNRKYARKELLLSLVRVANELDNHGQDELRKLADVCLMQASKKKIEKTAFPWVVAAIVVAVGVLYAQQHLPAHLEGWNVDYQKAQEQVNKLLTEHANAVGVGYEFTPEFLQTIAELQGILKEFDDAVKKVLPILEDVQKPRTGPGISQELAKIAQQPATKQAEEALKGLRSTMVKNLPFIRKILADFSSPNYKQRVIASKGALTSLVDKLEIFHGGWGLFSDIFDDTATALNALRKDLAGIIKELKGAQNVQQQLQADLQAGQAEADLMFEDKPKAPATPTAAPGTTPAPTDQAKSPADSWEEKAKSLLGFGG